MNENEKRTSISKARTPEEIGVLGDTHSLDDYWEQTHEVEFEVRAKQRWRIRNNAPPRLGRGMHFNRQQLQTTAKPWLSKQKHEPQK